MSQTSLLTDEELWLQIQSGNKNAFEHLYMKYWALLYVHSLKMIQNEEVARDIVQDLFVKLWEKRNEIHINEALKFYLYRSVRNLTINQINNNKQLQNNLDSFSAFIAENQMENDAETDFAELVRLVEKEIAHLPKKMKLIFQMSRYQGLSYQEIAEELDLSIHTVKKTISRAIKMLRTQIQYFFTFFF